MGNKIMEVKYFSFNWKKKKQLTKLVDTGQETKTHLHTSPGENSSSTDDRTSSARLYVKRAAIRPMPFAADQRTTVS